jgi:prepilin-type processing-associated H-X9-DG protein
MKRYSVVDLMVCLIVAILVAVTIIPAVARMQRSSAEAQCQSNMHRWAEAIALYTHDYDGTYPTNRLWNPIISVSAAVPLSPNQLDPDGRPLRFYYGLNWVEALYSYLIPAAAKTDTSWQSFLKCPSASTQTYPVGSPNARMTYSFNACLVEMPIGVVRNQPNLMMMREFDRCVDSCLRPTNPYCRGSSSIIPVAPFLSSDDSAMPGVTIDNNLHGGSYVLMADGHVRHFTADYFPTSYTAAANFDPSTGRWYNYYWAHPANATQIALNKSISISP